ncbi:MAG TPA: hypothetical protein VI039_13020 [Solirubrobacterales bacterium]
MTPLKEAKDAVSHHRQEIGRAIAAGEWDRAVNEATELVDRLADVATIEFEAA